MKDKRTKAYLLTLKLLRVLDNVEYRSKDYDLLCIAIARVARGIL